MDIRPIPRKLLCDSVLLSVPAADGYSVTEISSVRVVCGSKLKGYADSSMKEMSELIVYYDCVNSVPADVKFSAGMSLIFHDRRYEILSAEEFSGEGPHHIRITARAV